MFNKVVPCKLILCVAFMGLSLQASDIVVGEPNMVGTGNCDPFGCPAFFGLGTYQQVYLSSALPGSIVIDALTFYDSQVHNGGKSGGGTYTVSLSYTSNAPATLDLTNPNKNISTGSQVFFTGVLPALTSAGAGLREMVLSGTPFTYNPAAGNLLMTITVTNPANGAPQTLYLDEANALNITTSAYFGSIGGFPISGGNDQGGLITDFTYTSLIATPEPGSLFLLLTGTVLLGWKRSRCKTA